MKSILTALLLASFLAGPGYEAPIGYFAREGSVTISSPDLQNYSIVMLIFGNTRGQISPISACMKARRR